LRFLRVDLKVFLDPQEPQELPAQPEVQDQKDLRDQKELTQFLKLLQHLQT
jgi:hypothetical protein